MHYIPYVGDQCTVDASRLRPWAMRLCLEFLHNVTLCLLRTMLLILALQGWGHRYHKFKLARAPAQRAQVLCDTVYSKICHSYYIALNIVPLFAYFNI